MWQHAEIDRKLRELVCVKSANPAVSVLMAVRNGAPFLGSALESLVGQHFQDFEIIVVDNGSCDATAGIVADWARRDARIRTFRLDRPGLGRSLNYAASLARAPLLARLDSDDVATPSRLGTQHEALKKQPALGLLGSFVEVVDRNGRRLRERHLPVGDNELKDFLRYGNPFVHSTIMMRRTVFERVGGYRDGLRLCEDYDLWCRMAEVTQMANLDTPLVQYRQHAGAMSFRHATRIAVVDACIVAAQHARSCGQPEPFIKGCPTLRRGLPLLGVSRAAFRYQVIKVTAGAIRLAIKFGERERARQLRRRAWRLLIGLPVGRATLGGAGHLLSSYFRPYSRQRRQALRARVVNFRPFAGVRGVG
jgi:Glycosyl transferase family 2